MTGLALALAAGAALPSTGFPTLPALLVLLLFSLRPIRGGRRPIVSRSSIRGGRRPIVPRSGPRSGRAPSPASGPFLRWLPLAALAGLTHGALEARVDGADCRWHRPDGPLEVEGWVLELETPARIRLEVVHASDGVCGGPIRVQGRLPNGVAEGVSLRVEGRWVERAEAVPGLDPLRAGVLLAGEVAVETITGGAVEVGSPGETPPGALRHRGIARLLASIRAAGVDRIDRLFAREGDLVSALVFARRDGLAPELRDAFTTTGTAHLLAISGFHVGVLVGSIIWTLGRFVPPRRAFAAGTGAAWIYVAVLGFPDAATRAALLLTLVTLGRLIGRPVTVTGALGTALLLLVLVDPGVAGRVGAQLSFAGALGLAVWARRWSRALASLWDRHLQPDPGRRTRGLLDALAATAAASLATLPFVAWHFERVSLVALPASIGATPLVALALPSILVGLLLDTLHLPGAAIAAAGAEGLLGATRLWVWGWASLPGASIAVSRPEVVAALFGAASGWLLARAHPGVRPGVRAALAAAGVSVAALAWPVSNHVLRNGSLEVHMLDVGQGDAFALRTPAGRWVVIDAGPPTGRRLVSDLRRLGVRRVEVLLLSHPDADHVGGTPAVLEGLIVNGVVGPGTVRGAGPWQDAVRLARLNGVPWRVLDRGDSFAVDGVEFHVLHPAPQAGGLGSPGGGLPPPGPDPPDPDPNASSLVVAVEWSGTRLLFMGDVPAEVERSLVTRSFPVDVLKVGHHGSLTSSDEGFLRAILPSIALVSAGRGNRYGHPEAGVLARLQAVGADIWRTDVSGPVRVRVSRAGEVSVVDRR